MTTSYHIVEEYSKVDLIVRINNYLAMGWECQGGVFIDGTHYYQALVLHREE
jgi:hypothetical protein